MDRNTLRPAAGDTADYPLYGSGTWTYFDNLSTTQKAQARNLDRRASQPGALCLVADKSERVLRVL